MRAAAAAVAFAACTAAQSPPKPPEPVDCSNVTAPPPYYEGGGQCEPCAGDVISTWNATCVILENGKPGWTCNPEKVGPGCSGAGKRNKHPEDCPENCCLGYPPPNCKCEKRKWVCPPSPPAVAAKRAEATWKCDICAHVYDPAADGGGKAFEELPDTWTCPVCGSPKSAYKMSDGKWAHPAEAADWKCSVCDHVYDKEKDGGGVLFEDLPDTWKCPVCGSPKSAYKQGQSGKWAH